MSIEPLFTLKEMAEKTGRSVGFFRDLIASGEIEVVRKRKRGWQYLTESAWRKWQESHVDAPLDAKVDTRALKPPHKAPAMPKPFDLADILGPDYKRVFPIGA